MCFHSWLPFRCLLQFLLVFCETDEMGAVIQTAAFRKDRWGKGSSRCVFDARGRAAAVTVHRVKEWHINLLFDTRWFCVCECCVFFPLLWFWLTWNDWLLKGHSASKWNKPHHIISTSRVTRRERESDGNLISSQLEPLPHNEIWKGILRALFIIFFQIVGFWHRKFNSSGAG